MSEQAISYVRDRGVPGDSPYEDKFAGLIRATRDARRDKIGTIVVAAPWVLGDDYGEVLESLGRLAIANLKLAIVKPD
jgi:hypothetical protein